MSSGRFFLYQPNLVLCCPHWDSKIDVADAFRQVAMEWSGAPAFGYAFRDLVVFDRMLELGWASSHRHVCALMAALEHSHQTQILS